MQYMGGKARIAKAIVQAILADTSARDNWWEPFVGGGNVMEHAATHFRFAVGTDIHIDLIMMWEHVTSGGLLPEFVTREEYLKLKDAPPSWLRGYAGFAGSFGGKWFGGYGIRGGDGPVIRNGFRSVNRQAGVFAKHGVRFNNGGYDLFTPPVGTVIYCDPPYADTTGYSSGSFDHAKFYAKLREWAVDRHVYVSEYGIPADVPSRLIWQKEKTNGLRLTGKHSIETECLYRILP